MRVLVFLTHYCPGYKGGGPIKSIKNIVDKLGHVIDFMVITSDRDLGDTSSYSTVNVGQWNKVDNSYVFYVRPGWKKFIDIFFLIKDTKFDFVYLNSFFSPMYSIFPLLLCRIMGHKVLLAPRGELSPAALTFKEKKKKFYLLFFKIFRLHKYVSFHVSSYLEGAEIASILSDKANIFTVRNLASNNVCSTVPDKSSKTLNAVFLSRISPKKNILYALNVMKNVENPVNYYIYGPIEDSDYWRQCEEAIKTLPKNVHVEYKGPLSPNKVIETLSRYDVFFFPTRGENFGHVITEALCAGLPLLISDTTPWRDIENMGLGWALPLNCPDTFSARLDWLGAMSTDSYMSMRRDVCAWSAKEFNNDINVQDHFNLFKTIKDD